MGWEGEALTLRRIGRNSNSKHIIFRRRGNLRTFKRSAKDQESIPDLVDNLLYFFETGCHLPCKVGTFGCQRWQVFYGCCDRFFVFLSAWNHCSGKPISQSSCYDAGIKELDEAVYFGDSPVQQGTWFGRSTRKERRIRWGIKGLEPLISTSASLKTAQAFPEFYVRSWLSKRNRS